MTLQLTSDMKPMEAQVVLSDEAQATPKKSAKKYVIIAVASVVVIVLVIIAILVGVYLSYDAQEKLIERTMQLKEGVTQQTTVYPDSNIIQFTINDDSGFSQVVDDYNRYIRVTRMDRSPGKYCIASALNQSSTTDMTNIPQTPVNVSNAPTIYYELTPMPIPDVSFLSQKAQDMCGGIPIYWVYPSCRKPDKTRLQKRQMSFEECFSYCMIVCTDNCQEWCLLMALTCLQ